jgi:hypothetical protein
MARTVADLIEAYDAAQREYEVIDVQTRDWAGPFSGSQVDRDRALQAAADAEAALLAALTQVGPVVHRGSDYRLLTPAHGAVASDSGSRLLIGPAPRPASEVPAP